MCPKHLNSNLNTDRQINTYTEKYWSYLIKNGKKKTNAKRKTAYSVANNPSVNPPIKMTCWLNSAVLNATYSNRKYENASFDPWKNIVIYKEHQLALIL